MPQCPGWGRGDWDARSEGQGRALGSPGHSAALGGARLAAARGRGGWEDGVERLGPCAAVRGQTVPPAAPAAFSTAPPGAQALNGAPHPQELRGAPWPRPCWRMEPSGSGP